MKNVKCLWPRHGVLIIGPMGKCRLHSDLPQLPSYVACPADRTGLIFGACVSLVKGDAVFAVGRWMEGTDMPDRLRVGAVNYLNTKPLIHDLDRARARRPSWSSTCPAGSRTTLRRGRLDVALIPVIEYFRGRHLLARPGHRHRQRGPVLSVTLFSRCRGPSVRTRRPGRRLADQRRPDPDPASASAGSSTPRGRAAAARPPRPRTSTPTRCC